MPPNVLYFQTKVEKEIGLFRNSLDSKADWFLENLTSVEAIQAATLLVNEGAVLEVLPQHNSKWAIRFRKDRRKTEEL